MYTVSTSVSLELSVSNELYLLVLSWVSEPETVMARKRRESIVNKQYV